MSVTRRHHPLRGEVVEVLVEGQRDQLVVALPDGSMMWIPRAWTDADGSGAAPDTALTATVTVESVRELLALVATLVREIAVSPVDLPTRATRVRVL